MQADPSLARPLCGRVNPTMVVQAGAIRALVSDASFLKRSSDIQYIRFALRVETNQVQFAQLHNPTALSVARALHVSSGNTE